MDLVTTLETGRGDREGNMWAFAQAALDLLAMAIDSSGPIGGQSELRSS